MVGHDEAKLALILAAAEPLIGGVLLRGQKGSAKTTLARGLAALLDPDAPFVELPVGATEDRLIGSIDLASALTGGGVRFSPGLLAVAHGGVLYVDEVNLLADHLVDVLLDVATSGVNRVEREGMSHCHPSRFILIGSMNPEEGELRPQLLDRFGLAADVASSLDPDERVTAVQRRLAFDADPEAFWADWSEAEAALAGSLETMAAASVAPDLLRLICSTCAAVGAEGLRGDLVITRAAAALAGLEGHPHVGIDDVRRVAPLALGHRRGGNPFDSPASGGDDIRAAIAAASESGGSDTDAEADPHQAPSVPDLSPPRQPAPPDRGAEPGPVGVPPAFGPTRVSGGGTGRRSVAPGSRGRLIGDRAPDWGSMAAGVAVVATIRSAAVATSSGGIDYRKSRMVDELLSKPPVATMRIDSNTDAFESGGDATFVRAVDVREAVRDQRVASLVILVVDASGSMGTHRRMKAAKGALLGLLLDAYQRRDRVALVTFRGESAEVVLRPTGSVEVARARIADLATGGKTPLAAGIDAGLTLALAAKRKGTYQPLLVVITDGRATAASVGDPWTSATQAAAATARHGIATVVVDADDGSTRLGLAGELAQLMGARLMPLADLSAATLRSSFASTVD